MRNDLIELLALLVSVGYIKSFRVTKTYIYVTMKNDRLQKNFNTIAYKHLTKYTIAFIIKAKNGLDCAQFFCLTLPAHCR